VSVSKVTLRVLQCPLLVLAFVGACGSNSASRASDPDGGGQGGDADNGASTTAGGGAAPGIAGQPTAEGGRGGVARGSAGTVTLEAGSDGGGAQAAGASGEAGASTSCDFKVTWSLSPKISTVGIVEWTTALSDLTEATIQFGSDTNYGMTAPVELEQPNYRTLLVGMKALHAYHFRIVARGREKTCTSDDYTLATGPAPNGIPAVAITDHGGEHYSGFLLSSFITTGPAFMLDADGDYVWSYGAGEMGRAALSQDGKYVWYGAVNVAGNGPSMKRVTLDGLEETDFTAEFPGLHHDFTVLPDGTIAFLAHAGDDDLVVEHAQDGSLNQVLDVGAVLGSTLTHANSIHYHEEDDTYTVSDLAHDAFIKFGRDGVVVWILGGDSSDFSGDGATWTGQHGHQLLAPDRLLFFNNGPSNGTSAAIELKLDLAARSATRTWQYQSGNLHCLIYGDVERLDSDNTLVTFSTLGILHEVTKAGDLVREFSWPIGGALGYVTRIASPYPPFE